MLARALVFSVTFRVATKTNHRKHDAGNPKLKRFNFKTGKKQDPAGVRRLLSAAEEQEASRLRGEKKRRGRTSGRSMDVEDDWVSSRTRGRSTSAGDDDGKLSASTRGRSRSRRLHRNKSAHKSNYDANYTGKGDSMMDVAVAPSSAKDAATKRRTKSRGVKVGGKTRSEKGLKKKERRREKSVAARDEKKRRMADSKGGVVSMEE